VKFSFTDKDRGWAALVKLRGQRGAAKAGIVGTKASEIREGEELTNAELGLVHEFGSADGRTPMRSFLRESFDVNREKYVEHAKRLAIAIYEGKIFIRDALEVLGMEAASDMQALIRTSIPPPDAPATVRRKGSSTTLIDSAQLIGSISSAVDMGSKAGAE